MHVSDNNNDKLSISHGFPLFPQICCLVSVIARLAMQEKAAINVPWVIQDILSACPATAPLRAVKMMTPAQVPASARYGCQILLSHRKILMILKDCINAPLLCQSILFYLAVLVSIVATSHRTLVLNPTKSYTDSSQCHLRTHCNQHTYLEACCQSYKSLEICEICPYKACESFVSSPILIYSETICLQYCRILNLTCKCDFKK